MTNGAVPPVDHPTFAGACVLPAATGRSRLVDGLRRCQRSAPSRRGRVVGKAGAGRLPDANEQHEGCRPDHSRRGGRSRSSPSSWRRRIPPIIRRPCDRWPARTRPAFCGIEDAVDRIEDYDVVFVGFPTWGMQLPPPMKSFLRQYDLTARPSYPSTPTPATASAPLRTVAQLYRRARC